MQRSVDTGTRRALACLVAAAALVVPVLAATPARADDTGPDGCVATGGSVERTLDSGGRERTYRLHVPDGERPAAGWPVVLAFHGRDGSGAELERFTRLSELPAVVVYPEGVVGGEGKTAWTGAPYSAPGVDDVRFTADLLDGIASSGCADTGRVYAVGKSNGGGFAGVLACRMADRIAAAAPVAGAFYGTGQPPCAPSRPIPVIEVHGDADTTIPYDGDADRGLPPIRDWVDGWVSRDRCAPDPATRTVGPDVTVLRWSGCDGGAEVGHVVVAGGGHTWPGSDGPSGGGVTTQTVRATDLIWQFVSRYRLPA